jgi:hypothetical protein
MKTTETKVWIAPGRPAELEIGLPIGMRIFGRDGL